MRKIIKKVPKHRTFSQGYEFKNFEGQPEEKLVQIEIPAKVTIPLKQGFGDEVAPIVEPGQKVEAGQIIGRDDESVSSPVHSSVNGVVVKIENIDRSDKEVKAVVIESDGTGNWQRLQGHSSKWQEMPVEKIDELIYLSGAGSAGKAGIPTKFNSSIIAPNDVENVIIQGIGSEVHNLSIDVLLEGEGLSHFIDGLGILKKMMNKARFHLALNKSQKSLIKNISQQLPSDNLIEISTLAGKYPVDRDEVLTPLLLGGEFPHGFSAANIGAVVLDVQAVLHVYEAVVEGKPLIERITALCGPGFIERPHIKVRIGSSLADVISGNIITDKELRFVLNSSLTGDCLRDLSVPVDRTFATIIALLEQNESQFLAFSRPGFKNDSYTKTCFSGMFKDSGKLMKKTCGTNVHGELRPCIFCTFCEEVCPVGIIPHLLFHYVENDVIDETLLRFKIFNCIECNLCSYVCPSKIPLAQFIKDGKVKMAEEGCECPVPEVATKGVEKFKSLK